MKWKPPSHFFPRGCVIWGCARGCVKSCVKSVCQLECTWTQSIITRIDRNMRLPWVVRYFARPNVAAAQATQVWSCTADSWRWMTLCICSWNSFITILPSLLFMGYFIMLDGKRFPDKIWSGQKTSEFLHSLWKIHFLSVHLCTVYVILKILLEGGRCTGWRLLELHRVGVFVWWKVGWKAADF